VTADYATLRAEARENAEDNRIAAYQAHRDDYDRGDDGRFYHVAQGMEMEPS
jgi:hypothetical protein